MSLNGFKNKDYLLDEEGLYDYDILFSGNSFRDANNLPLIVTNDLQRANSKYLRENYQQEPRVNPRYYSKLLDNFSVRLYDETLEKTNIKTTLERTLSEFNLSFNIEFLSDNESETKEENFKVFLELLYQKTKGLSSKKCNNPKVFFEECSKRLFPLEFLWEFFYVFGNQENPLSYTWRKTPRVDFDKEYYSSPYFPEMLKFFYNRGLIIDIMNPNVVYLKRTTQQILESSTASSYYDTLKKTLREIWSMTGGHPSSLESYFKTSSFKVFMKNILTSRSLNAKKFHSRNLNKKTFDSFCKEILKEQVSHENSSGNIFEKQRGTMVS